MAQQYAYKYAYINNNGLCVGLRDQSDICLNVNHVPIEDDTIDYLLKYYYPIPETVTSHDDWQGLWYLDAAHTQLFEEGNV